MYKNYYFLGIGGIGMSAIARYFKSKGFAVAGYDRVRSQLCAELESEKIEIHYEDSVNFIPQNFKNPADTLVIFTPAIPQKHSEYQYFKQNNFKILKRAEILGQITKTERGLCIAGTHGKTTISTITAHLFKQSSLDCSAFLGGISLNYDTNLLLAGIHPTPTLPAGEGECQLSNLQKISNVAVALPSGEGRGGVSNFVVIEADEYDRSFHQLTPYMAVISSTDADHLDIYHTHNEYVAAFNKFTSLIVEGGALVYKKGISLLPNVQKDVRVFTYDVDYFTAKNAKETQNLQNNTCVPCENIAPVAVKEHFADFYADNIKIGNGELRFDFNFPNGKIADVLLGVPILINVENAVAAMALAWLNGMSEEEIKRGIASFRGIKRRFEKHLDTPKIYIDDYAHHPQELAQSIKSVKKLYADKKVLGVFQPHLYSRTQDFYKEFAIALNLLDEVILVEIYPARELPIENVTSELIYNQIDNPKKILTTKAELTKVLAEKYNDFDVLITLGAGDIDTFIPKIIEELKVIGHFE